MGRTTPPPPLDITTVFSELGRLARRRFACTPASARQAPLPAPSAAPCCGPAGEFWPTCQEPHHGGVERILAPPEISALDQAEQWALATPGLSGIGREDDGAIFGTRERYNPPQVPTPMIGVPQLSANDVPGLPFPCRPTFSAAVVPKRP